MFSSRRLQRVRPTLALLVDLQLDQEARQHAAMERVLFSTVGSTESDGMVALSLCQQSPGLYHAWHAFSPYEP